MAIKSGRKYALSLNGIRHIMEVNKKGEHAKIYGSFFPEPAYVRINSPEMIENGSLMGIRTITDGYICLKPDSIEPYYANNAFTFDVSNIREVTNEERL